MPQVIFPSFRILRFMFARLVFVSRKFFTLLNILNRNGLNACRVAKTLNNFQKRSQKSSALVYLKDDKDNSLHLGRKYARIFVLGHYLFLKVHSFPRASLPENCSRLGIDTVRKQISKHIFVPNGGYCLFMARLFWKSIKWLNRFFRNVHHACFIMQKLQSFINIDSLEHFQIKR